MSDKIVTTAGTQHVVHHHHLGGPGFDHVDALMWSIIAVALVIAFLA